MISWAALEVTMHRKYFVAEAWTTLTAKWWELWCATLFGRRRVVRSEDGTVYLREWRGRTYFMRHVPPNDLISRRE